MICLRCTAQNMSFRVSWWIGKLSQVCYTLFHTHTSPTCRESHLHGKQLSADVNLVKKAQITLKWNNKIVICPIFYLDHYRNNIHQLNWFFSFVIATVSLIASHFPPYRCQIANFLPFLSLNITHFDCELDEGGKSVMMIGGNENENICHLTYWYEYPIMWKKFWFIHFQCAIIDIHFDSIIYCGILLL